MYQRFSRRVAQVKYHHFWYILNTIFHIKVPFVWKSIVFKLPMVVVKSKQFHLSYFTYRELVFANDDTTLEVIFFVQKNLYYYFVKYLVFLSFRLQFSIVNFLICICQYVSRIKLNNLNALSFIFYFLIFDINNVCFLIIIHRIALHI